MNSERNPHLLNDPSGGGGCVIGNVGTTSSGGPIHGYGSPPGSHGGTGCVDMGVGPPCPVPTPPWVKPPSNHGNSGMMTPESDVSSCSSPASTSYGASSQQQTNPFPPQQHLQQRAFYGSAASYNNNNSCATGGNGNSGGNELSAGGVVHTTMNQMRSGGYTNSNAISSSTNNNGMFYDASGEVIDQSQYYHHHQQQQHFQQQQFSTNSNLHIHQQHKTGSPTCSTPSLDSNVNLAGECGGGGDSVDSSGGGNFYGFYNSNQSGQYTDYHIPQQQHHDLHQHHDTGTGYPCASGDHTNGNGNRMHQYYRQDGSSASANTVPVGHSGYFNNSAPNPNYPNSSGNSTPTRYGSPMLFQNNHNYVQQQQQTHHNPHQNVQGGQMPLRRNSIESFSSEPGDMHSSYAARFSCGSTPVNSNINHNNHAHSGGMSQMTNHHHNPFSTNNTGALVSNMIKRECLSNRGSPVMNPMTPNTANNNMSTGCWSPHPPQQGGAGYFPSSSPNSACTSSGSPNPCTNDNGTGNRTNFLPHNNTYNQGICGSGDGESGSCANTNFYPQQQQSHHQPTPTQFKSCAYEQSQQHHDIKEGIPAMIMNNNLKAASAVKHRSLSLSMPLPSYLENNGTSRSDLENNFSNNHRQQLPQQHHHQQQLHNNHDHAFNTLVDTPSHHSHQQCSTTGLVPPPEQNLLTPNSDDDIPFRAASAGGQSDLDSSYETMGEEGCSSTSTSVASHCMNTSGTSSCSNGGENSATVPMTIATTTEHVHSMSIDVNSEHDCQHHHHHAHVTLSNELAFSTSTSVSSCMQTQHHHHLQQHHHVASSMGMGMLELPNSTVALCTSHVDDLDESSTDSSVELHNVISAVVQNSSIETPENTMMGDDDDDVDHVVEGIMQDDDLPSESGFHHHHQDSQADVNVISTTTIEPDELDDDDVVGSHDHDVDDNCSESSMSHINSSFTADMFCDSNSNHSNDDNSSNEMVIATEMSTASNCDNDEDDANIINSSSGSNDFPCVPEDANFMDNEVDHLEEEETDTATVNSNVNSESSKIPLSPPGTDSTSISLPSPSSSYPQKISKRSFSDTDKDIATVGSKIGTTPVSATTDTSPVTLSTSFGAMLRKAKENNGDCAGKVGETTTSATETSSASQNSVTKDNNSSVSTNSKKGNNKDDKNSENSANSNVNSDTNGKNNDSANSSINSTGSSINSSSGSTTATTAGSRCKAIDIIISSSGSNNDNNNSVSIPKGWKREILKGSMNDNGNAAANNTTGVLYISPSDTKIRNLDELKNYIGSDGTCKCGLSCPLRLEVAFSFDPTVTNMTAEDEKENLALLHASGTDTSVGGTANGGGGRKDSSTSSLSSSSSSSSTATTTIAVGGESDTRLLCNHKRKIPKAEDSPLISSTRDDLGDFGEKLKKRRLSGNECSGEKLVSSGPFRKDPITTSSPNNGKSSSSGSNNSGGSIGGNSNNVVQNVPVPFCQQSPDTTTQTPQTEMSPASSVCLDGSTVLFSSSSGGGNTGGNRSLTSTPTPTSSSISSISSVTAAAATTTKAGSSPSQAKGHCDQFVWPSPPVTIHQTTSNLGSPTVNSQSSPLPQLAKPNQSGTFWLSPTNSVSTFSASPVVSSGSNSLTLNYVQSPNNNTGNCLSSGTIINSSASSSTAGNKSSASNITPTLKGSLPVPVTSISAPTATTTTGANSSGKKASYQPFSAKTVKRPSSPCPNIDVRQLPLEQNRPPPIPLSPVLTSISPVNLLPNKVSPLVSTTNIPGGNTVTSTPTLASLPTLPVVTNPNILFTVTPPLVATNKTEIVSLSTPTLPILPLLTAQKFPTVGPIDTTCGAPTIVTTLQPNTSVFSTIDANTLYPAALQKKESPIILPITSKPSVVRQSSSPLVKIENCTTGNAKKNDESSKTDKEAISTSKGKDGKDAKVLKDGDRCPLQLAQDILNRFEKKSGDKNAEAENNKSNNNNVGSTQAINSTTPTNRAGSEEKEKAKEKANTNKAVKTTKDGNKAEEKCNKNEVATTASVGKIDSSSLSSTTGGTSKGSTLPVKAANEVETNNKSSSVAEPSKVVAPSSTADIVVLPPDNKIGKISLDPSRGVMQQQNPIVVGSSSAPVVVTHNATIPLNTIVPSANTGGHQLQQQHHPALPENTIITSQTPVMGTTPLILKDGLQLTDQGLTLTTSVSGPIPTISLSAVGNQIIQTSGAPVPCSTTLTAAGLGAFGPAGTNQIILQQPQAATDLGNGANPTFITTSTGRYPILQTIQPLFLNSAGPVGGPLIISQPTQPSQDHTQGNPTIAQQSFIYDQNGTPTATIDATGAFQSMLQPATTTMVLDPSMCAGNPNLAGGKKKKKRLSKKQQQQQAQLQLQQQFILQQIQQAQQQQAAAAAIAPLTIFPQSFNLGPQGFSLQPTMNFFPTPTILTLPNLILNPADGTLFIQPSTPLPTATTAPMQPTMKLGNFPMTTTTTISQNPQNIAPKKDGPTIVTNLMEPLKPATTPGLDSGSDDSRRNPTPDSSTNDLQLGLINMAGPTQQTNTITLNIPTQTTTTVLHNASPVMNKKNSKSRTVSSSSTTVKRILPQKQILPKIDSTTPSTTENAN